MAGLADLYQAQSATTPMATAVPIDFPGPKSLTWGDIEALLGPRKEFPTVAAAAPSFKLPTGTGTQKAAEGAPSVASAVKGIKELGSAAKKGYDYFFGDKELTPDQLTQLQAADDMLQVAGMMTAANSTGLLGTAGAEAIKASVPALANVPTELLAGATGTEAMGMITGVSTAPGSVTGASAWSDWMKSAGEGINTLKEIGGPVLQGAAVGSDIYNLTQNPESPATWFNTVKDSIQAYNTINSLLSGSTAAGSAAGATAGAMMADIGTASGMFAADAMTIGSMVGGTAGGAAVGGAAGGAAGGTAGGAAAGGAAASGAGSAIGTAVATIAPYLGPIGAIAAPVIAIISNELASHQKEDQWRDANSYYIQKAIYDAGGPDQFVARFRSGADLTPVQGEHLSDSPWWANTQGIGAIWGSNTNPGDSVQEMRTRGILDFGERLEQNLAGKFWKPDEMDHNVFVSGDLMDEAGGVNYGGELESWFTAPGDTTGGRLNAIQALQKVLQANPDIPFPRTGAEAADLISPYWQGTSQGIYDYMNKREYAPVAGGDLVQLPYGQTEADYLPTLGYQYVPMYDAEKGTYSYQWQFPNMGGLDTGK